MPTIAKKTTDITWTAYTSIQHGLTGGGQFGDALPLDDVGGGGAGPFLVFENGIWKYPEQTSVGAVRNTPNDSGGPIFLINFMADLGANSAWTLHVKNDSNTSNTPYPAADAAKYTEGDITVDSGTSRYINKSYNLSQGVDVGFLIMPTQRVYLATAAAVNGARVRFTFSRINRT